LIKKDYVIAKRHILNELRANNMTIQELRFFTLYLSKINSKDISTRVVRFSLYDFQKIMDLVKINLKHLNTATDSLLRKIVKIPNENGGLTKFQLFKKCVIDKDEFGDWYVEIDAHDEALPLMFDFKERYFTYHLWNALRLKSTNQLRMYEILKQYEKIGERTVSVSELKELLGINEKEYSRYGDFRESVIDVCQEALKDNTDIKFTYRPTGKKGRGGKINYIKFTISKNDCCQLSLADFIPLENESLPEPLAHHQEEQQKRLIFWAEACNNEFSPAQIQILYNLIIKILPYEKYKEDTEVYDYLKRKYDELLHRAEQTKITHRFNYFQKMIEAEMV